MDVGGARVNGSLVPWFPGSLFVTFKRSNASNAGAMPLGMTGLGAAEGPVAGGMIRVEIRTVNHRFFNCFNLAAKLSGGGSDVERGQQAANGPCCDFLVRATDPGTNHTATPRDRSIRFRSDSGIASNCSKVIARVESNA